MANQTDFGITVLDLMAHINPSYLSTGWKPQTIYAGTAGVGGTNTLTDTAANWSVDQWAGWHLTFGSGVYDITANTKTVITISGTLTGTAAYTIGAKNFSISATDLTTLIQQSVAIVKSKIPERYRKMIYKIENEKIVDGAIEDQTTASLTYAYTTGTTLELYLNPKTCPPPKTTMLEVTTDYTITGNQNITFVNTLSTDSIVTATYYHALTAVPVVLKRLGVLKAVLELALKNNAFEQASENLKMLKEEYDTTIKELSDPNSQTGIEEFDNIILWQETKGDNSSCYGSFGAKLNE